MGPLTYLADASLTFTALGSGGDAFTGPIAVTGGQTYTFTCDYYSKGDGGFLGIDMFTTTNGTGPSSEQWLFGDSSYLSTTKLPDGATPGFATYTATFPIPAGVQSIRLKAEDYAGSVGSTTPGNSPSTTPVYFDNIGIS